MSRAITSVCTDIPPWNVNSAFVGALLQNRSTVHHVLCKVLLVHKLVAKVTGHASANYWIHVVAHDDNFHYFHSFKIFSMYLDVIYNPTLTLRF